MAAVVAQLQQDVDRILKRVDDMCQRPKLDAASHDKLKKLKDSSQQHRMKLQSLASLKGGARKAQKEKLDGARASIYRELKSLQVLEDQLKQKELAADGGSSPSSLNSTDGQVEVDEAIPEANDVKVMIDQLIHEEGDDCEMLEALSCKICQVNIVGCGPKMASCSHLFCGDCIAKWFEVHPRSLSWAQRASSAGLVPCPVCKEPLHQERDLFLVCAEGKSEMSALLWRMLSGVKIGCANNPKCRADGKCTWTGEYGSYQEHIQTCMNVPLEDAALPLTSTPMGSARSSTADELGDCSYEQHKNSVSPCETFEDKQEHDEETTFPSNSSQDALLVCGGCEDAAVRDFDGQQAETEPLVESATDVAQASDGGLSDLILQLMAFDYGANACNESQPLQPTELDMASQPLQPVVQQKPVEPAQAASVVAIRSFSDGDPNQQQLRIEVGELIKVLNEDPSGWTYGYKVSQGCELIQADKELEGWFPNWVIA